MEALKQNEMIKRNSFGATELFRASISCDTM